MNGTSYRRSTSWSAKLLIGLVLVIAGAAAATWVLGHYQPAARLLGIAPAAPVAVARPAVALSAPAQSPAPAGLTSAASSQISDLQQRLSRVENSAQRAEGFAGRADALVIAFAARRAIDRGVALGYLEPLLIDRFGAQHQQAVATVITDARQPIRLDELTAAYEGLGPALRRGGPQDSWWSDFRRQLGSLIEVHPAQRPAVNADARYARAKQRLISGDVDQALAETMRMPGAANAQAWVSKARRYIAAHRALDEIESAALLGTPVAGR